MPVTSLIKENDNAIEVVVDKDMVASAIRAFICKDRPELAEGWMLNPKYNIGDIVFAGTSLP